MNCLQSMWVKSQTCSPTEQHTSSKATSWTVQVAFWTALSFSYFNITVSQFWQHNKVKRSALTVSNLCCYSRGTLLLLNTSCRVSGSSTVSLVSLLSKQQLVLRLREPLTFHTIGPETLRFIEEKNNNNKSSRRTLATLFLNMAEIQTLTNEKREQRHPLFRCSS